MPILVQWKWKEGTKTFLVIFRFYDDYSKTNLRLKKRTFIGSPKEGYASLPPLSIPEYKAAIKKISKDAARFGMFETEKRVMTWAPSIPEMGYLIEVLIYAFMINGLSEAAKRELRTKLEVVDRKNGIDGLNELLTIPDEFFELEYGIENKVSPLELKRKKALTGFDVEKDGEIDHFYCFELCPEYIDYLKKVLESYIKG